jgi:non-ribosomal peptide synthetase component F
MEAALSNLVRVLEQAPDAAISEVDVLPAAEREQLLVQWNRTALEFPGERCWHELFEANAGRAPESDAVVSGEERLSYGELNARANRLAHHLRSLGVKADGRVASSVERGVDMSRWIRNIRPSAWRGCWKTARRSWCWWIGWATRRCRLARLRA